MFTKAKKGFNRPWTMTPVILTGYRFLFSELKRWGTVALFWSILSMIMTIVSSGFS